MENSRCLEASIMLPEPPFVDIYFVTLWGQHIISVNTLSIAVTIL